MAFIRCEREDNLGTALFVINGFRYDFRKNDIISYSGVGESSVDYKVESVKILVNELDGAGGSSGETSIWDTATILLTVSVVL